MRKKLKLIFPYIKGKEVLDIGSVGQNQPTYVFEFLKQHAKSVIGTDTMPSKDPLIKKGNAETINLKKKFDVVVAGDVIEHIANQGLFLKKNGILLITTPNARSIHLLRKQNPTHFLTHDKYTLRQLLAAFGFKIEKLQAYEGNKKFYGPLKLVCFNQQLFCVARKK